MRHSKLMGLELNPFEKFQRSGRISLFQLSFFGRILNPHRIRVMFINTEFLARCMPGHILRPKPKGTVKSLKRGSLVSRNRSGRKVSGSEKVPGSCIMPLRSAVSWRRERYKSSSYARFANTVAPLGMHLGVPCQKVICKCGGTWTDIPWYSSSLVTA